MVISSKVEITVLALKEQKSKDGTKTYYRLAVFDQINCESGMLPCSEEVAKLWQNKGFKSMDHVELGCEFNDQYDSFRVVSAKVASGQMTVCINLGGSHEILRLPSEPLKKVG